MKFGIVTFPGSNCDQDMHYVLRNVLNQDTVDLWHKDVDLQNCDVIVLPGGFSYGDYLRSGAIAKFSRIMNKNNVFLLFFINYFFTMINSHVYSKI